MTAPTASPARMSASASLRTSKNRRRALQALIAAPLLALGIAAGSGAAHASPPPTFTPAEVPLADTYCAVSGWPHGEIVCGTGWGANLPNGTQEIFGIGEDDRVWTDWGTEAHPSGWKSLGAPPDDFNECDPTFMGGLYLSNPGNYVLHLTCWDNNENPWFRDRSAGPNGTWGAWH